MRILQIGATFVGAQKKIEYAIHRYVLEKGHDSTILYAIGESNEQGIVCYENKFENLIRRGLRKVVGKKPQFAILSTLKAIRFIKRCNPDLVNIHTIHHGYLDYEMLLKYLAKRQNPVVFTVHDMWPFTGGCYYYTKENCDGWEFGCKNCPANRNRLDNSPQKTSEYYELKKNLFSDFSNIHFVTVSEWVASEMRKSFLQNHPISVIENGMDLFEASGIDADNQIAERYKDRKKLLSVAAAWDERKGLYRIFEMAKILGETYVFFLVGGISDELKRVAPSNIVFLGYVRNQEKLAWLYSFVDLYVSASVEETFGMTFIEAAFCGTKSIGFNSSAIAETVKGVLGYLVNDIDSNDMATRIVEIFAGEETKLSAVDINKIVQRYSSSTMAEKYYELYLDLLSTKGENREK